MENLDEFSEITELNFEGENPHLAICHESQSYSANNRHQALFFKSKGQLLSSEIVKSLEGVVPEEVLTKMSVQNKRNMLEEKIEERIRGNMSSNGDYVYIWVKDFNDSLVAFEYNEALFAVDYTESESGIIEVGEDPRPVSRKDLYVDSETGEELIKAVDWFKKNPVDELVTSDGEDEAGKTSTPLVETVTEDNTLENQEQVIAKSQAEFDELVKAQVEAALKAKEEAAQYEALVKSTGDKLEAMSFIAEESQEDIVKAILTNEQGSVVLSVLEKAQEAITKAKEEAEAEILKVKEEFGKQEALEGDVVEKSVTDKKSGLSDFIAKHKKA